MHISDLPFLIGLVRNELHERRAWLIQAQRAFSDCTTEQMRQELVAPGRSREQMIREYQQTCDRLQQVLDELISGGNS